MRGPKGNLTYLGAGNFSIRRRDDRQVKHLFVFVFRGGDGKEEFVVVDGGGGCVVVDAVFLLDCVRGEWCCCGRCTYLFVRNKTRLGLDAEKGMCRHSVVGTGGTIPSRRVCCVACKHSTEELPIQEQQPT